MHGVSHGSIIGSTLRHLCDSEPWKWRVHGKRGTVNLSRSSHRLLEDAGTAGVFHIPPAIDGGYLGLEPKQLFRKPAR